jgi:hypothetical protein
MSKKIEYEGSVTGYTGWEGSDIYLSADGAGEGDDPELWDVMVDQLTTQDHRGMIHFGKLRVTIEQIEDPPLPPPPPRPRNLFADFVAAREEAANVNAEPKCNCVHTEAPERHFAWCATWGGKRPPEGAV